MIFLTKKQIADLIVDNDFNKTIESLDFEPTKDQCNAIQNRIRKNKNIEERKHLKLTKIVKDSCGFKNLLYLNTKTGELEWDISGKSMGVRF